MSQPYIGQIQLFGFNFAMKGWAFCNGQQLPIAQNQALFSLLGTTYGGNGVTTFALPDLRGRVPMHWGTSGQGNVTLGEVAGVENVTLLVTQLPTHTHQARASSGAPSVGLPTNNSWANGGAAAYAASPSGIMAANAIGMSGQTQPHPNMQPYTTLNFCIALQGIFPSRN